MSYESKDEVVYVGCPPEPSCALAVLSGQVQVTMILLPAAAISKLRDLRRHLGGDTEHLLHRPRSGTAHDQIENNAELG